MCPRERSRGQGRPRGLHLWSSPSSYLFIYQVTPYHKKKIATSSRSISKASKHAIPSKLRHKLAKSKRYLVT